MSCNRLLRLILDEVNILFSVNNHLQPEAELNLCTFNLLE